MIVFRSAVRPRMVPRVKDPFEGRLRVMLGIAKARREPVTLARLCDEPAGGAERAPSACSTDGRRT